MKTAGLLITAALAVFAGVATAAPDPAARVRMTGILDEFNAISDIDIGNCDHEHPVFAKAYDALTDSPNAVAMHRVLAHFELRPQPPAQVEHNPTADQCLAALDKAKALFERHGDYIQKLAASLPPTAAAD
jgi:hypothetical protein